MFHHEHGYIPKAESLLNVWNLPSKADKEAYDKAVVILIWYMDQFLPAAVGALTVCGPRVRHYKKAVDRKNVNGTQVTIVSVLSEAWALVCLRNCHEKWSHCADMKKQNPKWRIPVLTKDNKSEVKKYHKTIWSDGSSGQHSGWDPAAIKCLNEYTKSVKEFRAHDSKQNWACHKEALMLLRKHHNITGWEHTKKKKRRTVEKELREYEDVMDCNDDDLYAEEEGRSVPVSPGGSSQSSGTGGP